MDAQGTATVAREVAAEQYPIPGELDRQAHELAMLEDAVSSLEQRLQSVLGQNPYGDGLSDDPRPAQTRSEVTERLSNHTSRIETLRLQVALLTERLEV